jgi:hypothetical protein
MVIIHFHPGSQPSANPFRAITCAYQPALAFGVRRWVG